MADDGQYVIEVELGNLYVNVEGPDEEWVSTEFAGAMKEMLDEAEEMSKAIRDGSRGCA